MISSISYTVIQLVAVDQVLLYMYASMPPKFWHLVLQKSVGVIVELSLFRPTEADIVVIFFLFCFGTTVKKGAEPSKVH
jgi:hypothetical protein